MDFQDLKDDDLRMIFDGVSWKTPPKRHQLISLAWGFDKARVSLWHGIGTGKSLTALYLHDLWDTQRHLVVCPNSVVGGWAEQIGLHTNHRPIILRGTQDERRFALFNGGPGVYVVNYEGLLSIFCDTVETEDEDGRRRVKHVPNFQLCKDARIDGVTADECHALANPKAIQTKTFHLLSKLARHAIIMTGTPISTIEQNLWGEYWCLDDGKTLGSNQWWFLKQYFRQDFWGGWKIKPEERESLLARVTPVTLRFSREECVDLPERMYETRTMAMTADQVRIHRSIALGAEFDLYGRKVTIESEQAAGKLSQVAGGFLIVGDETIRLKDNPKLNDVADTLDEVDGKIIIFHAYVEEGRMLEELCVKKKIPHVALRGEVNDKTGAVERFQRDPHCRVLVAHPRSGGVGLNLQVATVAGFYSNGLYGAVVREQAEGRIFRTGQTKPCLFIDWELEGSLDSRHIHRIERQADVLQTSLDFVRSYKS